MKRLKLRPRSLSRLAASPAAAPGRGAQISASRRRVGFLSQMESGLRTVSLRLPPGLDLESSLKDAVARHKIKAGFILSCVGSLSKASLRYAGVATVS